MGSACCVAARPQELPLYNDRRPLGRRESHWRTNGGFSPSVHPHWDNKLQAEDDVATTSSVQFQRALSSNNRGNRVPSSHFLNHQRTLSENVPNEGSPSDSFQAPKWLNSPNHVRDTGDFVHAPPDLISNPSVTQLSSKEGEHTLGSSTVSNTPEATPPYLNSLSFSSKRSRSQPPSYRRSIGSSLFFSRHPHHSSRHSLSRQISDSRIHARSVSNSSPVPLLEGRHSFKLSGSSGDSTVGFHGGASDWWSMQTFSDLVASSRRARLRWMDASSPSDFRWASNKESMDRVMVEAERIRASSSEPASLSSHVDLQTCGICSKLLTQKSPWSAQKMVASNDLSVIAVLVCGHVYHAECLEQVTPEVCCQDPPCPVCVECENMVSRQQKSVEQVTGHKNGSRVSALHGQFSRNKLSRIGVANDDIPASETLAGFHSSSTKDCLFGDDGVRLSSSSDKGFFRKSFSKKHFLFRGKSVKNVVPSNHVHKKGFWGRQ